MRFQYNGELKLTIIQPAGLNTFARRARSMIEINVAIEKLRSTGRDTRMLAGLASAVYREYRRLEEELCTCVGCTLCSARLRGWF